VRWGKPGGAEERPITLPCSEDPCTQLCAGCLAKLMVDPDWKNNRHGSSHSATAEPDDLNNNHGENWQVFCKPRGGYQGTTQLKATTRMPTPSEQQQQGEDDRHGRRAKLSESTLAAGVASFLGHASHAKDAVKAVFGTAAPRVPSQSHVRARSKTLGCIPSVNAQSDRPPPIPAFYSEDSSDRDAVMAVFGTAAPRVPSQSYARARSKTLGCIPDVNARADHPPPIPAFYSEDSSEGALAWVVSNPSSNECEEETGRKKTHQDPGQTQAMWPHERSHSAMAEWPPPLEGRLQLGLGGWATSTGDALPPSRSATKTTSRSSPDGPRCFDVGAAISKAGRQEIVLGNHYDSIRPRLASMISPHSETLGRRTSGGTVWPVGVEQESLEEFTSVGRQTPVTPRASSSRVHRRVSKESTCPTLVREIEDPRSLQSSQRSSPESFMGPKQEAKQSAAISAELAAKHGLSASGGLRFPKCTQRR